MWLATAGNVAGEWTDGQNYANIYSRDEIREAVPSIGRAYCCKVFRKDNNGMSPTVSGERTTFDTSSGSRVLSNLPGNWAYVSNPMVSSQWKNSEDMTLPSFPPRGAIAGGGSSANRNYYWYKTCYASATAGSSLLTSMSD